MIDHVSEMAAFVRVVDSKGFSAAAPVLGLTPSAVSLEDDGTVLVGLAARERQSTHPTMTATAFKRYTRMSPSEFRAR